MAHPSVERLSAYLDEQLAGAERRRLELHLEACSQCHRRLQGMRRVVARLRTLDRQAPPPYLGFLLRRSAALEAKRPTLVERLEASAKRFTLHAAVAPVFAVVLALGLIIYLLSWGIHQQEQGHVPVILEAEQEPEAKNPPAAEGVAARSEVPARAEVFGAASSEDVRDRGDRQPRERWAGREFSRRGEVWIEKGVEIGGAVDQFAFDDPVVQSWLQSYPELRELQRMSGTVRLRIENRVVEIIISTKP